MSLNNDAEALYGAVVGDDPVHCLQLLTDFKAHIKRDFVNLEYVPRYFETLSLASNSSDQNINGTAFTCISHLIKRVTMQDPSILKIVDYLVIPTLLSKLDTLKQAMAKKALLTYWEFCPQETELLLRDSGLTHESTTVRLGCMGLLVEIINSGKTIQFKPFLHEVVKFLDVPELSDASVTLLVTFYLKGTSSRVAKQDLLKELTSQKITERIALNVLAQIDSRLVEEYKFAKDFKRETTVDTQFVNAGSVRVSARAAGSNPALKTKPVVTLRRAHPPAIHAPRPAPPPVSEVVYQPPPVKLSKCQALNDIVESISGYELEDIQPVHLDSVDTLRAEVEDMFGVFDGKESEHNWTAREKNIIRLRRIIRGQLVEVEPRNVATLFRSLCEPISKAVGSLRTTLSSHGCQLVKEACIFIGEYFDSATVEFLAMPLIKLSGARKSISHHNAHVGMCGLLVHTHFNMRVVNQIYNASVEKNLQPRAYSAVWFQIILLRNMDDRSTLVSTGTLDLIEKMVAKGVSDPAPAVRESMRITFWTLHSAFPAVAEKIMSKCENNVRKALDRVKSLPTASHTAIRASSDSRAGSRPSSSLDVKRSTSGATAVPARVPSNGLTSSSITGRRTASGNRVASNPRKVSDELKVDKPFSLSASKPLAAPAPAPVTPLVVTPREPAPIFEAAAPVPEPHHEEVLQETPADKASRIFDCFAQKDKDRLAEGVDQLISFIQDADSIEDSHLESFKETLSDISASTPNILFPLVKPELIPRTCKLFFANDLIRVCTLSVDEDSRPELTSLLVDSLQTEDLCFSLIETLTCAADVSKVQNPHVSLQFFRHRLVFALFAIQTFVNLFTKLPVQEYLMTESIEALLSCWYLLSEAKLDLLSLLSLMKFKNEIVFNRGLNNCDPLVKKAVCAELGVSKKPESREDQELYFQDTTQGFGRIEMTMIRPGKTILGLDPSQANSDMTMVVSNFKKPMRPLSATPSFQLDETVKIEDKEDVDMDAKQPTTPVRSCSPDTQNLCNTMERVRISPQKEDVKKAKLFPTSAEDVDSIISQVDPFAAVVKDSSASIPVYEDKPEDLDTWYNIETKIFEMQNRTATHSVDIAIKERRYSEVSDLSVVEKLEAVLFVRQALHRHNVSEMWKLLMSLSQKAASDELAFAIDETAEYLVGVDSEQVYQCSIDSIDDARDTDCLNFILNSLALVFESKTSITHEQAELVDSRIFDSLSHPEARIRRATVGIYAQLMALSRARRNGKVPPEQQSLSIFRKFSPPQLKLVEFYSDNV